MAYLPRCLLEEQGQLEMLSQCCIQLNQISSGSGSFLLQDVPNREVMGPGTADRGFLERTSDEKVLFFHSAVDEHSVFHVTLHEELPTALQNLQSTNLQDLEVAIDDNWFFLSPSQFFTPEGLS